MYVKRRHVVSRLIYDLVSDEIAVLLQILKLTFSVIGTINGNFG